MPEMSPVIARIRALRKLFAEAHQTGMDCLAVGDLSGLAVAIRRERELIDEQQRLLDAHHTE